jgi:hypothetical protein
MADSLDIPDFLLVKNRKPLTPEQETALARQRAQVPQRAPSGRSLADEAVVQAMLEAKRQASIQAMKNRIARAKEPKEKKPTGTVWDTRTSRWVLPNQKAPTPTDLIGGASDSPKSETTKQIMDRLRSDRSTQHPRKDTTMTTKPDYTSMTGAQLLEAYNAMAAEGSRRKAKFENKQLGIAACEKLYTRSNGAAKSTTVAKAEKPKAEVVEKAADELTKVAKAPSEGARSRKLAMRIRVVTQKNPRREGTDAHRHFVAMQDGPTVGDYLARFAPEARRTAAQWLSNTVRDGHVEVV